MPGQSLGAEQPQIRPQFAVTKPKAYPRLSQPYLWYAQTRSPESRTASCQTRYLWVYQDLELAIDLHFATSGG